MTTTQQTTWRNKARNLISKGSAYNGPKDHAHLAKARQEHAGQFFTPQPVVDLAWELLESLSTPAHRPLSIVDSSCGSGALLANAESERHELIAMDSDGRCIEAIESDLKASQFENFQTHIAKLEETSWHQADVALINPPFSLQLTSGSMDAYPSCSFGPFGPHSSAKSHWYALDQAIEGADLVIAILPASLIEYLSERQDLASQCGALLHLGTKAFAAENVTFPITIGVFSRQWNRAQAPAVINWTAGQALPALPKIAWSKAYRCVRVSSTSIGIEEARILKAATNDRRVRITRSSGSRRLIIQTHCGAMQGRFMNALMREDVGENPQNKRPYRIKYDGEGAFDVENFCGLDNPAQALVQHFQSIGISCGAEVEIDSGLINYLKRRARRDAIRQTPFRHTVRGGAAHDGQATVIKSKALTNTFGGPRLRAGTQLPIKRVEGGWEVTVKGATYTITDADAANHLVLPERTNQDWRVIHEGKRAAFPHLATAWRNDPTCQEPFKWVSFGYQYADTIELLINGSGIAGWEMGLGKTRLSLALCMARGGKHNLIVIPAHLVDEFGQEIARLGIDSADWQLITTAEHTHTLRRLNLITYNKLRSSLTDCPSHLQEEETIDPRWGDKRRTKTPTYKALRRRTFATLLRHRINTMVCDEVHALRDRSSRQSKAIAQVSPKHRYGLTGTPAANYPRDVLPLIEWIGGDGTALAPYGYRNPYFPSITATCARNALKGQEVAKDTLMTFEWVTNEFSDDLTTGAKREVPKIKNVHAYRSLVAPHILRRILTEPEVAEHVRIPEKEVQTVNLPFDDDHLDAYLEVALKFADWYRHERQDLGRKLSLVTTLARIGAVERMCNMPQESQGEGSFLGINGLSSKERYAVERAEEWAEEGHKTVIFCLHPSTVDRLVNELNSMGVQAIAYHGQISIAKRTRALNAEFRNGDAQVLVATIGSAQTGLNLWQASRCIVLNRPWTPTAERQSIARLLRPQQKRKVLIEIVNIEGSLDEYQGQMIEHKAAAALDGFDYGESQGELEEFEHLDTLLNRFVEDLAALSGMSWHEFVESRRA